MKGKTNSAPKKSLRPKVRPQYIEDDAAAVERGRRAYEREMEDMPPKKMMGGGKVKGYAGGGRAISDSDRNRMSEMLGESGNAVSDADRQRMNDMLGAILGESEKTVSDRDRQKMNRKIKGYKGGGCVMAGRGGSYKGMR